MSIPVAHTSGESKSGLTTFAALFLFLISGLSMIFSEIPHEWALKPPPGLRMGISLTISFVFFPICLCIGWIKDFPRWSYPYVGNVLLHSLYMTNASTPGFLFGRELWGWRAWIPLLIVSATALLLTRSLHPLLNLFTNIKEDWTLLTFAMFGFMPLLIDIFFDEMDRLYSLYFMLILVFLMAGTVIIYMRSSTHKGRIKTLLIGVFLTITTAVSGPAFYWFHQMNAKLWPVLIAGIVIYLILFSPALIGIFHKPPQTA